MKSRKRDFGTISSHLSRISFLQLTLEFVFIYLIMGFIFALVYWGLGYCLPDNVFSFNKGDLCLSQSFYFSFITQLTIGYGDFAPIAYAQAAAIIQGILGVFVIGIWAGVFVAKWFTSGDKESIYFAKWAGYSLAEERFFILFVNRNVDDLADANINAVVRLSSYDSVPPSVNSPYIGKSAWTFALQKIPIDKLVQLRLYDDDGIKVSISGTAGMTRCTNWKRYRLAEIFVLPDRRYYWQDKFTNPKFDDDFYDEFERPRAPGAEPFLKFNFPSKMKRRQKLQQSAPADG